MGTKIKSQKNSLGLKRTPRNPLDQNDDCTVKRGCPLARFTGEEITSHGSRIPNFIFQSESQSNPILNFGALRVPRRD